jgi:subtilisin family serine protease
MSKKHAQFSFPSLIGPVATLLALSANAGAAESSYIVTAHGTGSAAKEVRRAGGRIEFDLPIIDGVSARLTPAEVAELRKSRKLELFADGPVLTQTVTNPQLVAEQATLANEYASLAATEASWAKSIAQVQAQLATATDPGAIASLKATIANMQAQEAATVASMEASWGLSTVSPDNYQRSFVGVDKLAAQGLNGTGVTVAVLDSGILCGDQYNTNDLNNVPRIVAQYDAINPTSNANTTPRTNCANDDYGHGTHVTSLIASSNTSSPSLKGQPQGIAPMVKLVNVRAFDQNGQGSYTNVLNGLNWILANRTTYGNIRVLNLSFGAKPQSFYWNDPIDQAVMKLWQAGVVVVAAAGNYGPKPQTISVPGNTPYVITVGAMTDNYTPNDPSDDGIASFSSAGPTYEGFVKPDVVAPGGHLAGLMYTYLQTLSQNHPNFASDAFGTYFMSGTSQATAVTTGVVALMLEANPALTPDQIKCRLLSSTASLVGKSGTAAYSVFQQGVGMINAYNAVYSQAANCANQGLNITKDLAGTAHFGGPAHQNTTTGQFYVLGAGGHRVVECTRMRLDEWGARGRKFESCRPDDSGGKV